VLVPVRVIHIHSLIKTLNHSWQSATKYTWFSTSATFMVTYTSTNTCSSVAIRNLV